MRYFDGTVSRLWLNTSGLAATTLSIAPSLRRKSGVSTSIVVSGAARRMAAIVRAKCRAPAIGEIVAVDRGHHDMVQPSLATASATRAGSSSSSGSGRPVRTLQKAQARVQVSPMIMKVAWRLSQHSPMLGQRASSQTVTSLSSRTRLRVSE